MQNKSPTLASHNAREYIVAQAERLTPRRARWTEEMKIWSMARGVGVRCFCVVMARPECAFKKKSLLIAWQLKLERKPLKLQLTDSGCSNKSVIITLCAATANLLPRL